MSERSTGGRMFYDCFDRDNTPTPHDKPGECIVRYRLLEERERIERDDESLCDDCQTWEKVDKLYYRQVYIGRLYMPMRRRVD